MQRAGVCIAALGYISKTVYRGPCTCRLHQPVMPLFTVPNNASALHQDQWVGYVLVCCFGLVFTLITQGMSTCHADRPCRPPELRSVGCSWLCHWFAAMIMADQKFGSGHKNSEDFQTCGRAIKTGLIAVGTHTHLCIASVNLLVTCCCSCTSANAQQHC